MSNLTVTGVSRAGVAAAPVAANGGGDTFDNTGKEIVEVVNGGGAPITVSFDIKETVDGGTVTDQSGTVAAGARKRFGPFPPRWYNDPVTGRVSIGYSGVSSVTVEVFKP